MLSRTAVHLFWMSRYTERSENAAEGGVSLQHCQRAQPARGSLPGEEKC